ncbi:MAG: hypothetical protein Q8R92_04960 [Deltaproteobacteria bacterium]|nr:hypothetical protein [Deltaproteobacteria bacterium]
MARYSVSQLRSKLQQAQQKQRQAVNRYNQAARRYNQGLRQLKTEVDRYNRQVDAHNARVRANRQRLRRELARLSRQPTTTTVTTTFTVYRTSVRTLNESYQHLDRRAESQQLHPYYNRVLDLSERETANSVAVTNRLLGVEEDAEEQGDTLEDAELLDRLQRVSPDLDKRWRGAVYALNESNPDAARHFCASAREIYTQILELKAPDAEVARVLPNCDRTSQGKPTRRAKIRFFLHRNGMTEETLEEFVEHDMENILNLFQVLNDGTHGSAGTYGLSQLAAIRKRVEDGITFLTEIAAAA